MLTLPSGPTEIQPAQTPPKSRPAAPTRAEAPPAASNVSTLGKTSPAVKILLGCAAFLLLGVVAALGVVGKIVYDRFAQEKPIAQVATPPAEREASAREPKSSAPKTTNATPPANAANSAAPNDPSPPEQKPPVTPAPSQAAETEPSPPAPEPESQESTRPAPQAKPTPSAPVRANLARLKPPVPRQAKYEPDAKRWVFSQQNPVNNTYGTFYLDLLPAEAPAMLTAYADKLRQKDFQERGQQFTEITDKGELPDGFFIQGIVADQAKPKPELGFVIVRKVNGVYLRGRNGTVKSRPMKDEELRQWMLDTMNKVTIRTTTILSLPTPSGSVLLPDHVTLIVSVAEKGELVYFNTMAERQMKRVEMDFQPGELALQKDTLFATAKGSSQVYALDARTGKVKKEHNLGGEAIVKLTCHPDKGLLYASTTHFEVIALDPVSGRVQKTDAKGQFLAVSPDGKYLYTGVQPAIRDEIEIVREGNVTRIFSDMWGLRSLLIKYAVDGMNLQPISVQNNAAVNGRWMHLTPDGKRLLMVGGGGWRPPKEGGVGGGYITAVFSTDNLQTMLQPIQFSGLNTIFHPVLNLGVANSYGLFLTLFNGKSLVQREVIALSPAREDRPGLLMFGGKGRKLILWNGDNVANEQGLHFLPLPLKPTEVAALEKAYGK